jgi:hypothetical protein
VRTPTIVGWIEQWYWKVPAFVIFTGAVVVPGAMPPVSQTSLFWVDVWVIESEFDQATVWPTVTVADGGLKDMAPFCPMTVIVMSAGGPLGAVGVELLLPQLPASRAPRTRANDVAPVLKNRFMIFFSKNK